MFVQPIGLTFGTGETPSELQSAFAEIILTLQPLAAGRDVETLAEILWSALHGLASLTQGERLRPSHRDARLSLLLDRLSG
jgi:hypothetical protein